MCFSMCANKVEHFNKLAILSMHLLPLPYPNRTLSALAYWSPIFGETTWLPLIVFPIIKKFPNNQIIAFEITCSILSEFNSFIHCPDNWIVAWNFFHYSIGTCPFYERRQI